MTYIYAQLKSVLELHVFTVFCPNGFSCDDLKLCHTYTLLKKRNLLFFWSTLLFLAGLDLLTFQTNY